MKTDIQTELTQALRSHEKVWANEEKTILAKNILLDLVEKTDPTIIGLLLNNDELKRHFFVEVNGVLVFKLQDFRFFLDKHSINNSYTKYANRIGLTDGNRFLKDSSDIVLDFPFKDCVLNGGQSTEEGEEIYFKRNNDQSDSQLYTKLTRKRQEIFFNQTLAFDEIDRLFDAKAFSKFSRHTADGKQAVGEIKRRSDGFLKGVPAENLIIKGNNLIALHSLAKQFKGKIKLIYIDVPFNTGNDSFAYNDKFNRSTWLTFMKNRLEAAKNLLAGDGVLFVHCDYNEDGYLRVLLDEIFTEDNFVANIAVRSNSISGNKTQHKEKTILKNKDTILVYKKSSLKINPQYTTKQKWDTHYNAILISEDGELKPKKLLDHLIENKILEPKEKITENSWANEKFRNFCIENMNFIYQIVNSISDSLKQESLKQKDTVIIKNDGDVTYALNGKRLSTLNKTILNMNGKMELVQLLGDLWGDIDFQNTQNEGGVSFPTGKKPEALLRRIIDMTTKEGDIVLDYHLGSGTTAAVAHKMNRQYIGIEQMDYIETLAVERLKKVIDGEQGGISKAVNWQGGGEFVYAELAPFNETAKQQILACENSDDIKTLFNELCERYFLKYNVSVNEFSQIIEEPEFQSLPLDEQKQMVLEMLDLNQMYVSLSEMDDEQFAGCLNDDDKALSRAFYQSVKNQAEEKDGE
ncbi:TPA: DNA methyltransferase [Haemophilus influenzae]|uniref:DNA methyltransferase n=2 Tax=Haemophilus influenzae TaxID=727 RepID=UPI000E34D8F8|nr:site-specific DNA-methyltransferase [Haemophilus influenzae]MCK9679652.1 site-specific DNA-methyltransferase [Haemophilus influenzae]RFO63795.1 site-specific DNA-methyltransferase [Haemophilus influenzae]